MTQLQILALPLENPLLRPAAAEDGESMSSVQVMYLHQLQFHRHASAKLGEHDATALDTRFSYNSSSRVPLPSEVGFNDGVARHRPHLEPDRGPMLPAIVGESCQPAVPLVGERPAGTCSGINWSGMSRLQIVDLSSNQLQGPLDDSWAEMPQLSKLTLAFNQFNGSLPASLAASKNLVWLELQNNQFSGECPEAWAAWTTLQYLDLSFNQLVGPLATFASMSSLQTLKLASNLLNGSLVDWKLSSLRTLDISSNELAGSVESPVGRFNVEPDQPGAQQQFPHRRRRSAELEYSRALHDLRCQRKLHHDRRFWFRRRI